MPNDATILPPDSVFISYRRSDTLKIASRFYDEFVARFGPGTVFLDLDRIPKGVAFPEYILERLRKCAVVIVVIGPTWLSARDKKGDFRLNNPDDHVRLEVEVSLSLPFARVIPVLVGSTEMPTAAQLPSSIRQLCVRNSFSISGIGPSYQEEMSRLTNLLRDAVEAFRRAAFAHFAVLGKVPLEEIRDAMYLSYSVDDRSFGRKLAGLLLERGVLVWHDRVRSDSDDNWSLLVESAVVECGIFVPIVSKNTEKYQSPRLRLEWECAAQRWKTMDYHEIFITPVLVGGFKPWKPRNMPSEFKIIPWLQRSHISPMPFVLARAADVMAECWKLGRQDRMAKR